MLFMFNPSKIVTKILFVSSDSVSIVIRLRTSVGMSQRVHGTCDQEWTNMSLREGWLWTSYINCPSGK